MSENLATGHVITYHQAPEGNWWAESSKHPTWTAISGTIDGITGLVAEMLTEEEEIFGADS